MTVTMLVLFALAGQVLLAASVVHRLVGRAPLRATLDAHGVLPGLLRRPVPAAGIEAGQLVVGVAGPALFLAGAVGGGYWAAACASAALWYAGFAGYLTRLLRLRGRVPCNCFGRQDRAGPAGIVRAGFFAVLTGIAVPVSTVAPPGLALPARAMVLAGAALVAGFAVYLVMLADTLAVSGTQPTRR